MINLFRKEKIYKKIAYKIFDNLLKEFKIEKSFYAFIDVTIDYDYLTSYCHNFYDGSKLSKSKIIINLASVYSAFKKGYKDCYYEGRQKRLDFLKSFKLNFLFAILHEFRHFIQARELISYDNFKLYRKSYLTEIEADNFAINYLKRKRLIKL